MDEGVVWVVTSSDIGRDCRPVMGAVEGLEPRLEVVDGSRKLSGLFRCNVEFEPFCGLSDQTRRRAY
jgi:hypothetical protein